MSSWKQKEQYEDSSQVRRAEAEQPAVQVTETEDENGQKKRGVKLSKKALLGVGIGAFLVIALLTIFAYKASQGAQMNTPAVPTDGIVNPGVEDSGYMDQFVIAFRYSAEELAQLRAWGYTGPEIEENQVNEVPAADLIEASRQAQEEARASLANPESPEYLNLLNQTWLGEPSVNVPYVDSTTPYTVSTRRINADYVKVAAHGTNLMLKVQLPSGGHHFMEVTVTQWSRLADAGNIVVDYTEISYNGQIFITGMKEVEV